AAWPRPPARLRRWRPRSSYSAQPVLADMNVRTAPGIHGERSPMEIDTLEAIEAAGTTQWIRIRGADASNPVLLLIQQGPGLPMINEARRFEHLLGLERDFTVVYWDQRGCGRSLRGQHRQEGITVEAMVADTV